MNQQTNACAPINLTINLPARTPSAPSKLSCQAATLFGLSLEQKQLLAPDPININLSSGAAILITGRSGSGKTTLLDCANRALKHQHIRTINPDKLNLRSAPIINLFHASLETSIRALAAAGLAEPTCFAKRPNELSTGQRARLRLALALHHARRAAKPNNPVVLILDEFAAALDKPTARALANLLRRALKREPALRALIATPHQSLQHSLRPESTINLDHAQTSTESAQHPPPPSLQIQPADFSLYKRFAHLHYRSAKPSAPVCTLAATFEGASDPVGILVVSMPTLNAAWRESAWPHRYTTKDRALNAKRLNAEVRRIARVIVDPPHRTLGVATALVRHYLENACTPNTEAVASMGAYSSFFRAAGMTQHDLPLAHRHQQLLDLLTEADIAPWRLAMPTTAWHRAKRALDEQTLERALTRWATASRATRALANESPEHIFTTACKSIASPRTAFTHAA